MPIQFNLTYNNKKSNSSILNAQPYVNFKMVTGLYNQKHSVNLSRIICLAHYTHTKKQTNKKKNPASPLYSWILWPSAVIPTSHIFYCSMLVSIFCLLPLICLLICSSDLSACTRFSCNAHPLAKHTTTPFPSASGNLEWVSNNLGRTKQSSKQADLVCFDATLHLEMRNEHERVSRSPFCKCNTFCFCFDIRVTEHFNEAGQIVLTSISLL